MADVTPQVAVIMGSSSDWETMKHACAMLDQFGVPYMKQVISAHRTPELMAAWPSTSTTSMSTPSAATVTSSASDHSICCLTHPSMFVVSGFPATLR